MSAPRAPRTRSTTVAAAARAGESSRRTWFIVAGVVVVGLAAVLAISLAGEESTSASAVADVELEGTPLPPFPQGGAADTAVGQTAPTLAGTGLDGEPLRIEPGDGRPKVLSFFAHWCPVCQTEVPALVSWIDGGGLPDDVDLYGVSTGIEPTRGNYPPGPWFEREGWTQPTLVDSATSIAGLAYGLTAYPYFVALDAEGRVTARGTGALSIAEVESLIDGARAGADAG